MRWKYVMAAVLLTAVGLVSWGALAQAQPTPAGLPGSSTDLKSGELPPPPPGAALPGVPPIPPPGEVVPVSSPMPLPIPPLPSAAGEVPASPSDVPGVSPPVPPPGQTESPQQPPPAIPLSPVVPSTPKEPTMGPIGPPMPVATPMLKPTPAAGPPTPAPVTPPAPSKVNVPQPMRPEKMPLSEPSRTSSRPEALVTESPQVVDMPTGRQEPAVSLEWGGSGVAKIGQVGEYTLSIRNTSVQPVQGVTARVRLPQGLSLVEALPKPVEENGLLLWDLGTMTPRQERVLHLKLRADAKGDMMPQA